MREKHEGGNIMFNVGDNVVYPMHGVGTIEKIEEKEILNKRQTYYFIKLKESLMTVMIPLEHSKKARIRKIIPDQSFYKVKDILESPAEGIELDWKVRYNNNQQKVKDGSIELLSEVVRDLYHRNNIKELSRGERNIYDNAFEMLTDELTYTDKIEKEDLKKEIIDTLENKNEKIEAKK